MTTDEPLSSAAYGRPQALAWNSGTIASSTSSSTRPSEPAVVIVIECR